MNESDKYICWGDDHEDLTPVVQLILKDDTVVILRSLDEKAPAQRPRILVTCSKDHENIFEIGGFGEGRRPSDAERPWVAAMKELTPTKSFEMIEKHATFVFANLSVFTTLITGFAIVSDFKAPLARLWLMAIPVTLLAVALMLAALAITPRVVAFGTQNLTELEAAVEARLRSSGARIRIAGILFALAILSVVPIYAVLVRPSHKIAIRPSFRWATLDKVSTLTVAADLTGVRAFDEVSVRLNGIPTGASPTLLLEQSFAGTNDGTSAISVDVPNAERFARYELTATVKRERTAYTAKSCFAP